MITFAGGKRRFKEKALTSYRKLPEVSFIVKRLHFHSLRDLIELDVSERQLYL